MPEHYVGDKYISEAERRAGNADRDRYIDHLANAVSTGHLREEEFSERRDKALLAKTKTDLITLVADLPDMPVKEIRTHNVTYQVAGGHFSPWRWGVVLVLSVSAIGLPGPLMAAAFHGFDHAPMSGGLPILLIIAGIVMLLFGGIGWCPDHTSEERIE